ncbi:DoxX family protein [Streptomyces angustmyceticus]|uniref:DoxX family protein n=1 Tax=Streptomyces angustmyceticus TaxID=285578 RepID=UPI003D8BE26C
MAALATSWALERGLPPLRPRRAAGARLFLRAHPVQRPGDGRVLGADGADDAAADRGDVAASGMGWDEGVGAGTVKLTGGLEVLAALGLVLVMLGATVVHARRSETQMIAVNLLLLALAGGGPGRSPGSGQQGCARGAVGGRTTRAAPPRPVTGDAHPVTPMGRIGWRFRPPHS